MGVGKTNTSSAWFMGFEDVNGQFQKCINYSRHDFVVEPKLIASPRLTKVLMVGEATRPASMNVSGTGNIVVADFYLINCPTFQNISFPMKHMTNLPKLDIVVGE